MTDYRVPVTGSQLWTDKAYIFEELDWEFEQYFLATDCDQFVLVHGDCPNGADAFAKEWAESRKRLTPALIRIEDHPADWKARPKEVRVTPGMPRWSNWAQTVVTHSFSMSPRAQPIALGWLRRPVYPRRYTGGPQ